jgi:regulator of sigma E protease
MVIFLKVIQVIFALSLLVLIHELGHFAFARLFKIRVDKFYLFFDAGFALFRWKPKNSDTEYGIGWLPLGGYCKIAGMIDESMDKDQLKSDPKPWEFRAHPAWQRFWVLFGGVFFNFLLAILIYAGILFTWGEEYIKTKDVTTGIAVNDLGREMGFRNGDKIVAFDGVPTDNFANLRADLIHSQATEATVIRDGKQITVNIDQNYIPAILNSPDLFEYGIPFTVGNIPDSSQNLHSGLKEGDVVIAVDSVKTQMFTDVKQYLEKHKGDTINATIVRSAAAKKDMTAPAETLQIPLAVNNRGLLNVSIGGDVTKYYKVTKKTYSLAGSVPAAFSKASTGISNYWKELKLIFTPRTKAYKSVGSFIAIGQIFPGYWDWHAFWSITAFLSIMLAVLNILPIPALDGGHILFTFYEIVTGRKPSDKFLMAAQVVGMVLLIALMVLAFGNDIARLFR